MGMAGTDRIFIWNPKTRKVEKVVSEGKTIVAHQGTRALLCDGKRVIVLFRKSIAEYNMKTGKFRTIATYAPGISSGGDLAKGRVWFISQAHLMSAPY